MPPTLGLLSLLALAPADVRAAVAVAELPAPPARVVLHAALLDADAPRPARRALTAGALLDERSARAAMQDDATAGGGGGANVTGEGAGTGTSGEHASGGAAAEDEEPSIDLIRQREHMIRVHRILGFSTLASLAITEIAGTILAVNQRTLFGPGNCNVPTTDGSNPCLLGDVGTGPLDAFHELSAFITVGLYTATGLLAVAAPDPEHASRGHDARARNVNLHRAMAYIHLGGMILLPILGILSYEPGLVGLTIDPNDPMGSAQRISDYQAAMRTVHLGVGYVTLAALTTAMLTETVF